MQNKIEECVVSVDTYFTLSKRGKKKLIVSLSPCRESGVTNLRTICKNWALGSPKLFPSIPNP